ncbi:MAG: SDR family oxidoreductase [Xanthobacteraceae bacterium]|nr:SDR family oxidoreductase [Xanthobacteraceae bacterium]
MPQTARRVAWITGGGTGIGLAGAEALAADGWRVVVSGRRADVLDGVVRAIADRGGDASACTLDVGNAAQVAATAQDILKRHGRIDCLVNSAGLNIPKRSWADVTIEGFDQVVDINLNGLMYCIHAVLPAMREQGDGCIINIASWAGRIVSKLTGPAYTATKHAVVALTHSLNMEEFRHGIRACALSPGEVATPIMKARPVPPSAEDMARMLQPADLGRTIAFVANMPAHVCVNEILISPTWNRSFAGNGP